MFVTQIMLALHDRQHIKWRVFCFFSFEFVLIRNDFCFVKLTSRHLETLIIASVRSFNIKKNKISHIFCDYWQSNCWHFIVFRCFNCILSDKFIGNGKMKQVKTGVSVVIAINAYIYRVIGLIDEMTFSILHWFLLLCAVSWREKDRQTKMVGKMRERQENWFSSNFGRFLFHLSLDCVFGSLCDFPASQDQHVKKK